MKGSLKLLHSLIIFSAACAGAEVSLTPHTLTLRLVEQLTLPASKSYLANQWLTTKGIPRVNHITREILYRETDAPLLSLSQGKSYQSYSVGSH